MLKLGLLLAICLCYWFKSYLPHISISHKYSFVSCGDKGHIVGLKASPGVDVFFGWF